MATYHALRQGNRECLAVLPKGVSRDPWLGISRDIALVRHNPALAYAW